MSRSRGRLLSALVATAVAVGTAVTASPPALAADVVGYYELPDSQGDATATAPAGADTYALRLTVTYDELYVEIDAYDTAALASTTGGDGVSVHLDVVGRRPDGQAFAASVDAMAGSVIATVDGQTRACAAAAADLYGVTGLHRLFIPNRAANCLGLFSEVAVAATLQVAAGSASATDRVPDSGYSATVGASTVASTLPKLYKDGHLFLSFTYADAAAPVYNPLSGGSWGPFSTRADFGNPGDIAITADSAPLCYDANPNFCYYSSNADGLVLVRAQPDGGLHWYKLLRQAVVCCPGGYSRGNEATTDFSFGNPGDLPLSGDWDGDGTRTVGVFRPSTGQWFLTDDPGFANAPAAPLTVLSFGSPGDQPVAGDWDGDGYWTPAVVRQGAWYQLDTLRSGAADRSFYFGQPGDIAVPGDWNGDRRTTPGIYRSGRWFITNNPTGGLAQNSFTYGDSSYQPVM